MQFLSDIDIAEGIFYENVPMVISNITFESTKYKKLSNNIPASRNKGKKLHFWCVLTYSSPLSVK